MTAWQASDCQQICQNRIAIGSMRAYLGCFLSFRDLLWCSFSGILQQQMKMCQYCHLNLFGAEAVAIKPIKAKSELPLCMYCSCGV